MLAAIPDGPAKTQGIAIGKICADAVLTRLLTDGAATAASPLYISTGAPGDSVFTPFNAPPPPGVVGLFPGGATCSHGSSISTITRSPGPIR